MEENIKLNVELLRKRVPNLTVAAKSVGLRPATVSNLSTGKIPLGQAKVKTLTSLAELANCTVDELIIRGDQMKNLETGIKVIDLFAPIVRGGTVGLVARPGMGQLVVLAEVFYRMKKSGFKTVFCMLEEEVSGDEGPIENADYYSTNINKVKNKIKELLETDEVVLGVDRSKYLTDEFQDFFEEFDGVEGSKLTFLIVDTSGDAVDEDLPYGPLDTLWHFDMSLASRGMYPAIDSLQSVSIMVEEPNIDENHLKMQLLAQKVLRRYRELTYIVEHRGLDRLSDEDQLTYKRGQRLEMYFTQPFYVAEPFTNKKGEWVSTDDLLADVKNILEGKHDQVNLDEWKFVGSIS
ncbi:hypothetical protein E3U55_07890 [Filobacillus milosensis]|uniref:Uncharacterized protein n=1 Tax=Filobacillus milosensis TaxID=94137 RepID=A0A4Y8INK7_9BACI|nr:hypothetical protein [Filobacillus milosensis]TFB21743.1 hypothetical protein E3U55_07890 [Filobacillus milosensis]